MSQYKQDEFCLDFRNCSQDSLPTWMKGIGDRRAIHSKPIRFTQLPLFDISLYAASSNTSQTQTSSTATASPGERVAIPSSEPIQP